MIEAVLLVISAILLDMAFGDPKNKYHPTAWIGKLVGKITPLARCNSPSMERFSGVILVLSICGIVLLPILLFDYIHDIILSEIFIIIFVIVGAILLKVNIAIKGMQIHSMAVIKYLENNDIKMARVHLAMIVKRDTSNLDENHIISGVLESISENIVDGITGPLFYFALFGLPGAFVYRAINTMDSMIGYKNVIFKNIGWFAANCDKILNYIPSRLTALIMIASAYILQNNWKDAYKVMINDASKTQSPNAGYPMATLAGALNTSFEKINHYKLGYQSTQLTSAHVKSAIMMMKITSILFCVLICIPLIALLSYVGLM